MENQRGARGGGRGAYPRQNWSRGNSQNRGRTNQQNYEENYRGRGGGFQSRGGPRGRGQGDGRPPSNSNWRRGGRPMNFNEGKYNQDERHQGQPPQKRSYNLSYTKLLNLSEMENNNDVVLTLANSEYNFETLIQDFLREDLFVLIIKVLAKVCMSDYVDNKIKVLTAACNSHRFIQQLPVQIAESADRPTKEVVEFCHNIVIFFENASLHLPTLCSRILPTMKAINFAMLGVNLDLNLGLDKDGCLKSFQDIINDIKVASEETAQPQKSRSEMWKDRQNKLHDVPAPDDFRVATIYPTPMEILEIEKPFLRPNLIDKAYASVDHYLDVQFRLMKEDYVRPLREGIAAINSHDHDKIREANVKICDHVKFIRNDSPLIPSELSKKKKNVNREVEGVLVYLNFEKNKSLKRTDWAHCRRFMFGSLLCFSNDNFKTLHLATVVDRDSAFLEAGFFRIQFCEYPSINFYTETFTMIESEVFFDPYNHVLRTLQVLQEDDFPLAEYIVKYQQEVYPPAYLEVEPAVIYNFPQFRYPVTLLDTNTWPGQTDLDLDETQYKALYVGLTREMAIIQGPPGTGKTFIGLKIAQILVENRQVSKRTTPILVVCLTNHALDQFLVGISKFTEKIIRIGGQSKCDEMAKFNLKALRRHSRLQKSRYVDVKQQIAACNKQLLDIDASLKELNRGIVSYGTFKKRGILQNGMFPNETQYLLWLLGVPLPGQDFTSTIGCLSFALTIHDLESTIRDIHQAQKHMTGGDLQKLKAEFRAHDSVLTVLRKKLESPLSTSVSRENELMRRLPHLNLEERWLLYKYWTKKIEDDLLQQVVGFDKDNDALEKQLVELQMVEDLELMKESDVVGMTTSGAARLQSQMRKLGAEIVIVEEAAEVMETHVVACLSKSCLHLILIGDHKQLRPSVAVYQLARDYNFDISLFERMVNRAPDQCVTLGVQHRMAPEIASLIVPAIYEKLLNDRSVTLYDPVKGCPKRMFFLDHTKLEAKNDSDSHSRMNVFEADFLLALCRHLLMQGYDPSEITILATYRGQMFHMRKEKSKYPDLNDVLITVVDNYQGEENKIILLSLVRSNPERKIGFLRLENRVNVALSRARHGLYIVGNMECLAGADNCTIWKSIRDSLAKHGAIGSAFPLKCQNHGDQEFLVSCGEEFGRVSPQGGCTLICNEPLLGCAHTCPAVCHIQRRDHSDMKCLAKCGQMCASIKHKCEKKCYEPCGNCTAIVAEELPCKHVATFPCYMQQFGYACIEDVEKLFPKCGHRAVVKCHIDPMNEPCEMKCDSRLECGHQCENQCHPNVDPDHLNYTCLKTCNKINLGCSTGDHRCGRKCQDECQPCNVMMVKRRSCGHDVRVLCSADPNIAGRCDKMCSLTLPCGHKCDKPCMENCNPCGVKIKAKHPVCGHILTKKCGVSFAEVVCQEKCNKELVCGHLCQDMCGLDCISSKCQYALAKVQADCGHDVQIYCWERRAGLTKPSDLKRCTAACGTQLFCEHTCPGTCGSCFQGRFHELCNQPCGRNLICNHVCKEKCVTMCPPCPEKCSLRCEHSKCPKKCGEPCMPCKERCSNGCEHRRCSRSCGDKCDIDPCSEPCKKKLKCSHPCVGMCGETCPPLCRECDKEKLTENLFGDEDEPDARFVYLPLCKHSIEINAMDRFMAQEYAEKSGDKAIKSKECPKCKTRVASSNRYGNIIKDNQVKVNLVKLEYFGKPTENEKLRRSLIQRVGVLIQEATLDLDEDYPELGFCLKDLDQSLQPVVHNRKNVQHKFSLLALQIEVDILTEICKTWGKCKTSVERGKLKDYIDFLLQVFESRKRRISQQQVEDFKPELLRLQYIQILISLDVHSRMYHKMPELINKGLAQVKCRRFDNHEEEKIKVIIKEIKEICKNIPGLGITEVERVQIVQAIGLTRGHWFICPNGHPYAIGECGGAMQESKCPECHSAIGGGSHRLREGNTHFSGMDGSSHAAWSDQANMANYQF